MKCLTKLISIAVVFMKEQFINKVVFNFNQSQQKLIYHSV